MPAYREGRFSVVSRLRFGSPNEEYFIVQEDVEGGYMERHEEFDTLFTAIEAIEKSKALRPQT